MTKDEALAQPEQELTTTLEASIHAGLDKKNDKNPQVDHHGKQPEQEPCRHRIADIRNEAIKSGYMCMDCGALFGAYTTPPQRKD